MNIEHKPIAVEAFTTVTFDEPRVAELRTGYPAKTVPIRIEMVRLKWEWKDNDWILKGVTHYYRKVKTNGESYANQQWDYMNPVTLVGIMQDVVSAAVPPQRITITEGKP